MNIVKKSVNRFFHKPLRLYWWRYEYPNKLNFGDELTPIIIGKLFGYRCQWTPPDECRIVGIGSILESFLELNTNRQIYIWGTGFIKSGNKQSNESLVFCAVRGSLSRDRVGENIPIGDPGLLVNLVFKPSKYKSDKIGIIPHYVDEQHPSIVKARKNSNFLIINPLDSPERVIKQITSCKLILSSSLHGLIVADSFGIPNMHMPLSSDVVGGSYKFKDYYSATDRDYKFFDHKNLTDINALGKLLTRYKPIKNLDVIQDGLIKAFPEL